MFEHKLCLKELKEKFVESFSKLELKALDNSMINSTPFSDNLIELLNEELNNIDQYFSDLLVSYQDEDLVPHKFYDFYHRFFSLDISNRIVNEIKEGTSNVEEAFIIYDEFGYKVFRERDLPEGMKSKDRECNTWGEDCVFPIVIDKNIMSEISGATISLVKLSSLEFYNSKEDYIGNVLRQDLNENIINDKNEEAKKYYIEVVKEISNKDGNNLENEINAALSLSKPKKYNLEKH